MNSLVPEKPLRFVYELSYIAIQRLLKNFLGIDQRDSIQNPILHDDSLDIIALISWKDDDFMAEISALTENALPLAYLDIIEESYLSVDAEFIRLIIPFIEKEIPVLQSRKERS